MNLHGKVIVVTGGARDIGRDISLKLARSGAKVVVNYFNSTDDAMETLKMIEDFGGEAVVVRADMTKEEEALRLIEDTCNTYGDTIYGMVNNAGGIVGRRPFADIDVAFWDLIMELNIKTTFLGTKVAVPKMTEGGSIVNLSSLAGRDGGGYGASAYATSKGAIMTFTRSMAKELGPRNIRVNAVCPGLINTSFHDRFTKDEVRKSVAAGTPLRREGKASEVADLVAYLLSDEASFVTGTNIDINGGTFFS